MEMGYNPNHLDNMKQTPLFYAAREGKNEIIKLLISNGANINHADRNN